MSEMEQLLTAQEVATVLNLRVQTIYAAVSAEKIPHVRLWRGCRRALLRFREADILDLIESRTIPVSPGSRPPRRP